MRKMMRALLGFFCSLLMLGCDHPGAEFGLEKLTKGVSTEADVRSAMGEPEITWEEENGIRTLEYPKGPAGHRTYMVDIDTQGKLLDYTQVLTAENFATIKVGMSRDEVRRKLGRPRTVGKFNLKSEEVWDWRYLEGPATERFFNVHFDIGSGKVTSTSVSDPTYG